MPERQSVAERWLLSDLIRLEEVRCGSQASIRLLLFARGRRIGFLLSKIVSENEIDRIGGVQQSSPQTKAKPEATKSAGKGRDRAPKKPA